MTPMRNQQQDVLVSKPEVAASNTKESVVPTKGMTARHTPSKHENLDSNGLLNLKDKNHSPDMISWLSLPANLLKPGKVSFLFSLSRKACETFRHSSF